MAEYIDREKVMKAFSDFVWNSNHSDLVPAPRWNDAVEIVRDMKAEDVKPVEHDMWIKNDNGTYSCSVCQSWITEEQHYYARFCLYCGKEMRT